MIQPAVSYKRHRFPPSVIAHAMWLNFRFPLSLRLVEEMLFERGIVVSYDTIRCWAKKFGPDYAGRLRRKPPNRSDVWHLDEVVVTIGGRRNCLWRAVDQDGYVLDEIVHARRNAKAKAARRGKDRPQADRARIAGSGRQSSLIRRRPDLDCHRSC